MKMASSLFTVGELVKCQERTCLITQIVNRLGFNRYHVTDIDTGHSSIKFCYELKRCDEIAAALLPEVFVADVKVEDEADIPEELGAEQDPPVQPATTRWAVLIEDEVDHIAENRHSKHTATRTKWAAKVFRGMFRHCKTRGGMGRKVSGLVISTSFPLFKKKRQTGHPYWISCSFSWDLCVFVLVH